MQTVNDRHTNKTATRRNRRRQLLATLLLIGLVAILAIASRHLLSQSVLALRHIYWKWIPLALLAELSSMSAFARAQRRLLHSGGIKLQIQSVIAVVYAGNAIALSLPIAGAEVGTAYSFREFRKRGVDSAAASWALAICGLISSFAFALILAAGAITSANSTTAAVGLAVSTLSMAPLIGALIAIRYPSFRRLLTRLVGGFIRLLSRIKPALNKKIHLDTSINSFLDRFASIRLKRIYYLQVFLYLLWNWLADCACLAIAIHATGSRVPWHGLLLAYGVAVGAGALQFTPGGVGVIEVALSAALVAAGMNGAHALAAVLVYRIISFWLVVSAGWLILAVLRRSEHQGRPLKNPN